MMKIFIKGVQLMCDTSCKSIMQRHLYSAMSLVSIFLIGPQPQLSLIIVLCNCATGLQQILVVPWRKEQTLADEFLCICASMQLCYNNRF